MPTKSEFTGVFADLLDEVGKDDPFVLTNDIQIPMPTRKQIKQFFDADADADERTRVLIGEQYDKIVELFDDKPFPVWNRFIEMLTEHVFGKGADKVEGN